MKLQNPDRLFLRIALILLSLAALLSSAGGVAAVLIAGLDQLYGLAGLVVSAGLWGVCCELERIGSEAGGEAE